MGNFIKIGWGVLVGGVALIGLLILWASSGRESLENYARVVSYGDAPLPPRDPTLTLVSYNIGYLSGLANAALETDVEVSASRASFDANQKMAIAALQAVNPDILAVQEVDLDARRSYGVNQVEALAQGLGLANGAIAINWDKRYVPFPYWPLTQQFGRTLSGQAILSRFPIQNHERHVLDLQRLLFGSPRPSSGAWGGGANPGGDQCASRSL